MKNKKLLSILLLPFSFVLFFLASCDTVSLPSSNGNVSTTEKSNESEDLKSNEDIKSDEEHEHEFKNEVLLQEANCESAALYAYGCSCGEIDYEKGFYVGSPLGHDFVENASENCLSSYATCTSRALYYYSCSRCGLLDSNTFEYGNYAEHDFTAQKVLDSTLIESATCNKLATYYYSCSICGKVDYEHFFEIGDYDYEKHNHLVENKIHEATCTSGSFIEIYCEDCGNIINEYVNDDILPHNFIAVEREESLLSPATCQSPATYYYSCENCGLNDINTFTGTTILSHNYIKKISKDTLISKATCQSPATYYYSCELCGELSNETFTSGTKAAHNLVGEANSLTLAQPATCTTKAKYYYTCSVCKEIQYDHDTFELWNGTTLEHDHDLENPIKEALYQEATCTSKALYYYSCSKCNAIQYIENKFEYGDYKEHEYVDNIYERMKSTSTCTSPAIWYYACKNCFKVDYTQTFEFGSPLGHDYKLKDYHYMENLDDENYIIMACSRCDDSYNDPLFVEENSNVYNFEYEPIKDAWGKIKYYGIIKYKTFYGDSRDINITLPTSYKGCEVNKIKSSTFENATNIESITILNSLSYTDYYLSIYAPVSLKLVVESNYVIRFTNNDENFAPVYHISGHTKYDPHFKDEHVFFDFVSLHENDDYEYILCNDGSSNFITIKKYKGNEEEVIIPETIDNYPVKRILSKAFYQNNNVKCVITPLSLTEANKDAFSCCEALKHIYAKTLSSSSFIGNYNFVEYGFIEKGIITEGSNEFEYIIYNDGTNNYAMITEIINWNITSISGSYTYFKDLTKIGEYTINAIGKKAFSLNLNNLIKLQNISHQISVCIPTTIEIIELEAFKLCDWINNINPTTSLSSLKYIENNAFYGCSNLISIPDTPSLISIGDYAFWNCKIETINTTSLTSIGRYAFYKCSMLSSFEFKEGLINIEEHAFSLCTSLTSIYIPSTLETLDDGAFSGCSKLNSVTFADNIKITRIPTFCFSETAISSFKFPSQITSIGSYAFDKCPLKSIYITKEIKSIGYNPFAGCNNLERIVVDSENEFYTSYNSSIYNNYESNYGINAIVEIKNNELISGCKNSILISPIKSLGVAAFELNLEYIYIPSTIKEFKNSSLYYVKRIYLESDTNTLNNMAYNYNNVKTNAYGVGVTSDGLIYGIYKVNDSYEISIDGTTYSENEFQSLTLTNTIKVQGSKIKILDDNIDLKGYIFTDNEENSITCNVTAIGANAFKNYTNLLYVTLSNEVYPFNENKLHLKTIGENAFSGCSKLYSISFLPISMETIESGAFKNCTSLTKVHLYGGLTADEFNYTVLDNNEYFNNATIEYYK